MTLKNNRHIFYANSNFVHHVIAISVFKLELQSGNAQFQWKLIIFFCPVWPWKTIGHLFYATWSFVHHLVAISEFKLEIQSGNAQFGSKSKIFLCHMTFKFARRPWKTIGHVKLCVSSYRHMWIKTGVRVLKRVNWILTSVILTFCMAITSGNGNHSWNFMMIRWQKHCQKGVTDRRTGRQTERSVLKDAWSQLKMSRTNENPVY